MKKAFIVILIVIAMALSLCGCDESGSDGRIHTTVFYPIYHSDGTYTYHPMII